MSDKKGNTGDLNTGYRNTGDRNTGDLNTGYLNTGYRNTGHLNTGHRNTGHRNTGDLNTGYRNTGDLNTGDWNTGYRNTGLFCTETPQPTFFDKPWDGTWDEAYDLIPYVELSVGAKWTPTDDMTDEQKAKFPNYATIGGCLEAIGKTIQEAFPLAWAKLDDGTRQKFLDLPNFDAGKFLACTGVDVRKPEFWPANSDLRGATMSDDTEQARWARWMRYMNWTDENIARLKQTICPHCGVGIAHNAASMVAAQAAEIERLKVDLAIARRGDALAAEIERLKVDLATARRGDALARDKEPTI